MKWIRQKLSLKSQSRKVSSGAWRIKGTSLLVLLSSSAVLSGDGVYERSEISGTSRVSKEIITRVDLRGRMAANTDQRSPTWIWATQAGIDQDSDTGVLGSIIPSALVLDRAGNIYLAGYFVGRVSLGSIVLEGGSNPLMFVAKLNSRGQFIWARQGDPPTDPEDVLISSEARALAVDSVGNVCLAGDFSGFQSIGGQTLRPPGNAFIAKLDPNGRWIWIKQTGAEEAWPPKGECGASAIAVDPMDNILLAGSFLGSKKFGPIQLVSVGGYDTYVVKFNSDGVEQWARGDGGVRNDYLRSLTVTATGDVLIAGFVDAEVPSISKVGKRAFISRLNASGAHLWTAAAAGEESYALSVAVNSFGEAFFTGFFFGKCVFGGTTLLSPSLDRAHIFAAKASIEGAFEWAIQTSGNGYEDASAIALDAQGNPIIVGSFSPFLGSMTIGGQTASGSSSPGTFVAALSRDGNVSSIISPISTSDVSVHSVALGPDGGAYFTGVFQGQLTFGDTTQLDSWSPNFFLSKLQMATPMVRIARRLLHPIP